jgi:hypothetical protein
VAEDNPELAAKTIKRALDGLPFVLVSYMPEGVYPESPMYWEYGTVYSLLTASMLETAFGSDFGHKDYPGFMESAVFKTMCSNLPSGWYYNFADCKDEPDVDGDVVLAWFAAQTGKSMFYEKEKFLRPPEEIRLGYLTGAALAWMSRYQETSKEEPPLTWVGKGKTFYYSKNGKPEEEAGIYERDPDSGAERLIYHNPKQRVNFRWMNCSRDYKWLSFIEYNTRLMVVNLETGESHEAYPKSGFSTWSPDGQKLLALKTHGEDDGYRKSVVTVPVFGGTRNEIEFGDTLPERGRFSSPDWAPDGSRLAFVFIQRRSEVQLYKNIIPKEKK